MEVPVRGRLVVNSIPLAIEAAARAFLEITKMHLDCLHGQAAATRD